MTTFESKDHPRSAKGKFTAKGFSVAAGVSLDIKREPLAHGAEVRLVNATAKEPVLGSLIGEGQSNTFGTWTVDVGGRRFRDIGTLEAIADDGDDTEPFSSPTNPVKVPAWRGIFPRRRP